MEGMWYESLGAFEMRAPFDVSEEIQALLELLDGNRERIAEFLKEENIGLGHKLFGGSLFTGAMIFNTGMKHAGLTLDRITVILTHNWMDTRVAMTLQRNDVGSLVVMIYFFQGDPEGEYAEHNVQTGLRRIKRYLERMINDDLPKLEL